jgi:hypothetical protein
LPCHMSSTPIIACTILHMWPLARNACAVGLASTTHATTWRVWRLDSASQMPSHSSATQNLGHVVPANIRVPLPRTSAQCVVSLVVDMESIYRKSLWTKTLTGVDVGKTAKCA